VEAVREAYAAFDEGDLEVIRALCSDDIEWHASDMFFDHPRTYRGWQAWQEEFLHDLMALFDQYSATPEKIIDAGEHVLVVARVGGPRRLSGAQVEAQVAHVLTFSQGRVVRFTEFRDLGEARKAASLNA
jgi:ketosteroid isomerase-like protein